MQDEVFLYLLCRHICRRVSSIWAINICMYVCVWVCACVRACVRACVCVFICPNPMYNTTLRTYFKNNLLSKQLQD